MVTFQKWWQLILCNLYLSCAYSWFEVYFVARIWASGTNPDDWLRLSWRGIYTGCPSPEDSLALWTTFVLFSGLKSVTLSFICLWWYIALSGYYSLFSLQQHSVQAPGCRCALHVNLGWGRQYTGWGHVRWNTALCKGSGCHSHYSRMQPLGTAGSTWESQQTHLGLCSGQRHHKTQSLIAFDAMKKLFYHK